MCLSSPKAPAPQPVIPPPPPPTPAPLPKRLDPAVKNARRSQVKQARTQAGTSSLIATSPLGLQLPPALNKKKLLGA